jgi:hypothetical protein
VKILAQKTADLLQCPQVIYKTICNGSMVFKFAEKWDGAIVETVYPTIAKIQLDRNDINKNILRDSEDRKHSVVESGKGKNTTK